MYRFKSFFPKIGGVSVSELYETREAAENAASEEQRKLDEANAYFGTNCVAIVEIEEVEA